MPVTAPFTLSDTFSIPLAALTRRVACPDGVHTATNAACCTLFSVVEDIQQNLFDGGECGEDTHESPRLTFHDAIGFSPVLADRQFGGGGADGSIITFESVESVFHANNGIDEIINAQKPFIAKHNITAGDFIQLVGAVGFSNCAGAPQLEFMFGRPDATAPSPDLLVPEPFDDITKILARFADAADHVDSTIPARPSTQLLARSTRRCSLRFSYAVRSFPAPAATRARLSHLFPARFVSNPTMTWPATRARRVSGSRSSTITPNCRHSRLRWLSSQCSARIRASQMVDCSEVIPVPPPLDTIPHIPAGLNQNDTEQACATAAFQTLPVDPGPQTSVSPVPPS